MRGQQTIGSAGFEHCRIPNRQRDVNRLLGAISGKGSSREDNDGAARFFKNSYRVCVGSQSDFCIEDAGFFENGCKGRVAFIPGVCELAGLGGSSGLLGSSVGGIAAWKDNALAANAWREIFAFEPDPGHTLCSLRGSLRGERKRHEREGATAQHESGCYFHQRDALFTKVARRCVLVIDLVQLGEVVKRQRRELHRVGIRLVNYYGQTDHFPALILN